MAANEERTSLWRTPLSTPVRTNENGIQDLFRHSEKLLASAVSICRLKGSVECQTGGIITVCEEMQRLIRLAFSENARIEKEMRKQKLNYDDEISLLKERVTFLEEEKGLLKKHFKEVMSKNVDINPARNTPHTTKINREKLQKPQVLDNEIQIRVTDLMGTANQKEKEPEKSKEVDETLKENVKPGKKKNESKVVEDIPMETNSEDIDDASLEVSYLESPKASKVGRKLASKKVGKKAVSSKKKQNKEDTEVLNSQKKMQDDVEYIADSDVSSKSRRSSRRSTREDAEKAVSVLESPQDLSEPLKRSVHLNPKTGLLETVEVDEEPAEQVKEKPRKNAKKKDMKKNRKDAKNIKEGSKAKSKTEREGTKGNKNVGDCISGQEELVGEFPGSGRDNMVSEGNTDMQKTPDTKEKQKTPSKSKAKTPAKTPEDEEELGDVGFLIDISSMITTFVSNSENTDLELPLMSARERADARKLAALFNLHTSIGNKVDNRSSLKLSKTSNSKMPKPGKLDNLLSQLSIAAAREAEKASAKTRTKRKLSSVPDSGCNDEESTWDDSQPKRNSKTVSRSKKARI